MVTSPETDAPKTGAHRYRWARQQNNRISPEFRHIIRSGLAPSPLEKPSSGHTDDGPLQTSRGRRKAGVSFCFAVSGAFFTYASWLATSSALQYSTSQNDQIAGVTAGVMHAFAAATSLYFACRPPKAAATSQAELAPLDPSKAPAIS